MEDVERCARCKARLYPEGGSAIPVHEINVVLKELWREGMNGEFDDSECDYPVNEVLERAAKRLGLTIDFDDC